MFRKDTLIGCFQFGHDWIEIWEFGRFQVGGRDRPGFLCRGTIVIRGFFWVSGSSSRQGAMACHDRFLQRAPRHDEALLVVVARNPESCFVLI